MDNEIIPNEHSGRINVYSQERLSKKQLIFLIEKEYPDTRETEGIVVVTTVSSNDGIFQSFTFGKVLDKDHLLGIM